jgi:hypothetical protein
MRATFVRKPYPDLLARLMIELPDLLLKSPDQSSPNQCIAAGTQSWRLERTSNEHGRIVGRPLSHTVVGVGLL